MILGDAECISRGKGSSIGFAIRRKILRPRQCGFERPSVANAYSPAVLCKLFVVRGKNDADVDPDPLAHFASSRSALRRFFIIFRAVCICVSNTGSLGVRRKPSGEDVSVSVSPFSTFSAARASFGKITPSELPICVTLIEIFIRDPEFGITDVITELWGDATEQVAQA